MAHDDAMAQTIGVLGLGAWGSTLSGLFVSQGHQVQGWSRRLGGDPLEVFAGADLVVVALSMAGIKALVSHLAPRWPEGLPLVSCSKGIDLEAGLTPSQLWRHHNGAIRVVVLSGPNLAAELAQGLPAASVLACDPEQRARDLQQVLSSDTLRLYTNPDPVGTEVAGALKNVMAIAGGVSDGLGLGANAKASLLCRALVEMGQVMGALGGDPATLYGLAGLGDLLATSSSPLSRNYQLGLGLARGEACASVVASIGATVEGVPTALAIDELARRHGWTLPICQEVVALIAGRTVAADTVRNLMQRDLRAEGLPLLGTSLGSDR